MFGLKIVTKKFLDDTNRFIESKFDRINELKSEIEIHKTTIERGRKSEELYDQYMVAVSNSAKALRLAHEMRLNVIKDKLGPKAVMEANANFVKAFEEHVKLCLGE